MRYHALTIAITLCITAAVWAKDDVTSVVTPPAAGGNTHYAGNREPLLASPLIKLPPGAVRADGWLLHQLELMADGMTGRLTEISPWCEFNGNAWTEPHGQGKHGWEELPYWLKGFVDLGYVLGDDRIIKESRKWIDAVLASQRPDGYFGDEKNRKDSDLWPNMVMLYALRTYHEATGDERVVPFMTRYFKWQASLPLERFLPGSWQKLRAGDNLESIEWLYNLTGERWLLDLARTNHDCTANWKQEMASWHGVNIAECFREPAQFYQQALDVRFLKASERLYDEVIAKYGQVPGGMYGADENARAGYSGPRQGTETCAIVEMLYSHALILRITGDARWADRCEDVTFNMLPPAMTPDLKALHYLTAPNQVQLDRVSKAPMVENGGDMFSYTPYEQYRCCQHNVAMGWPYFTEHLWMATQGNGLAAAIYAPCKVKAKVADGVEVTIEEKTDYPFGESVQLKISTPKAVKFPLLLRIPAWCAKPAVSISASGVGALTGALKPSAWVLLDREWKDGDEVRLDLPMQIRTRTWKTNGNTISVDRGPLTYSLKIAERWAKYDNGKPWAAFEVFPETSWNYGLVLDAADPAKSFEAGEVKPTIPPQPFTPDAAPITLKARGKRIPEWKLEANGLIGQIQGSPVSSSEPEEDITLIPMGCARLRVSAFPLISDSAPPSSSWGRPKPPAELVATASHVHATDTVAALNDNVPPQNSGDTSIPRFTWWDRRGTGEWVQYAFDQPRELSWCEVYWFDDAAAGGHCRRPASWKVLYTDDRGWHEVKATSKYGVNPDRFNRVTFEPVKASAIRIFAELRPDFSAGLLEWRIGN